MFVYLLRFPSVCHCDIIDLSLKIFVMFNNRTIDYVVDFEILTALRTIIYIKEVFYRRRSNFHLSII